MAYSRKRVESFALPVLAQAPTVLMPLLPRLFHCRPFHRLGVQAPYALVGFLVTADNQSQKMGNHLWGLKEYLCHHGDEQTWAKVPFLRAERWRLQMKSRP